VSWSAPKNTLEYQIRGRPMTMRRDMQKVPVSEVITALQTYEPQLGSSARPETCALTFYLLEQALGEVRNRKGLQEDLGELVEVLDLYHSLLSPEAVRLFYYLLMICTREARHAKWSSTTGSWEKLKDQFGAEIHSFWKSVKGGESEVLSRLKQTPPKTPIGPYVKALSWIFYNVSFTSGYGGKKWGNVADVLVSFVHGKYTAAMMMDVGWTLAHNGGPIFNKGMLYKHWGGELIKILDVQRSGQIAQLIDSLDLDSSDSLVPMWLRAVHKKLADLLGDSMRGHVDWFLVEKLGAVGDYSEQKKKQQVKGLPAKDPTEGGPGLASTAILKGLEILPGVVIPKVDRHAKESA